MIAEEHYSSSVIQTTRTFPGFPEYQHFPQTFQAIKSMFSTGLANPGSNNAYNHSTVVDSKQSNGSGNLRKGLERLIKVLENKVDRQILDAQNQARNSTSNSDAKPRQS
ncbi:hypothetical protein GQ44DRAFT_619504 [Phaeosphaeriaceae sp. PMI808]|nr:hypothetical protein GQ44DRAFT_619504 [Phaeosphaeriaceae sp. PMI808]